ncbi:MAG: zinc ABC transporter substrate-binding protein [Rubrivivax sp.]|nr:zinc ABC transporter substrate-binding protein [Rubrivivax sp.]
MIALTALTSRPAQAQPQRRLRVVASFSILADMVRNVGGDAIELSTLVGADADAHVFEPTPADARRLADADLVVVNSLGFEGWLDRLVRASGYKGAVVVASAGITARRLGREADPHAWQDLAHARRYLLNLREVLAQARPGEAAGFEQRAAAYSARMAALSAELRTAFDTIPRAQRRVTTAHDAFGYLGAAYGIDFLAPQGMSTDGQPAAAAVARLIDQIRKQGVRAVFVENISDPRLVERIAREGGATVGGRLYSVALSPPGTAADTYLKLFTHNAATLAAGLRGQQQARIR